MTLESHLSVIRFVNPFRTRQNEINASLLTGPRRVLKFSCCEFAGTFSPMKVSLPTPHRTLMRDKVTTQSPRSGPVATILEKYQVVKGTNTRRQCYVRRNLRASVLNASGQVLVSRSAPIDMLNDASAPYSFWYFCILDSQEQRASLHSFALRSLLKPALVLIFLTWAG